MDHLAALAVAQRAFATRLAQADPEAPVTSCAPWRVADLALHLGTVHWWAAAMATGVDLSPPQPSDPRGTAELGRFYGWAATHLHRTLAELAPEAPALTLNGPGTAGFWRRRQLHETLVHLWDLAGDAATDAEPTLADAWPDTVAEVVDTMTPRQVRLGRIPALDESVVLVSAGMTWTLGPGEPAVAVHGGARDLALLLWGRRSPESASLRVDGDRAALDRVLGLRLTP